MCSCIVLAHFYDLLLQDLFLSLGVFASKGQNMTFTVKVLLTCIYIVMPNMTVIRTVCKFSR